MPLPHDDLININLSDSTGKIIAEYISIGGSGMDMRSKAHTLPGPISSPAKLSKLNYDCSSTDQAPREDSEVLICPLAVLKDPSREGNNILVMCVPYTSAGELIPTNKRFIVAKIISRPEAAAEEPRYGIEQQYTLLQDIEWPVGGPVGGFPSPQGPSYCGIRTDKAFGRDIVNSDYKACQYAGINIIDIFGKFMAGQGPYYHGVRADNAFGSDIVNSHLKACQYAGINISDIIGKFMPGQGDWNGAVARTNYSTKSMKKEGGMEVFNKAIEKLGFFHKEPTAAFGEGNEKKPIGGYATADISLGVADSGASICVGCDIEGEGKYGPFLLFFVSGVCSKKIVQTRAGRMAGMMAQAAAKAWGKSGRN